MDLLGTTDNWPAAGDPDRAADGLRRWQDVAERQDQLELREAARAAAQDPGGRRILEALFGNSPFLTRCIFADVSFFLGLLQLGPDAVVSQVISGLKADMGRDRARVMRDLRVARRELALTVAVADIGGLWPLFKVTESLSRFAEAALSAALRHLLQDAAERGQIALANAENPARDCGYVVLAMGKLGAGELNYSSDIDLIVVFDPDKAQLRGSLGAQETFVRITRGLVTLMEERTPDGYVFRTDLRLRPDPGAMPVAISFNAAMAYYESMGQNWERAAMIKARPVAGDLALGRALVEELRPFVWRKNLDFWAIQDIHSIKRQIHAHRGGGKIALAGHNVKLGRGGIREIEFFAQTQQLIFGGRDATLRSARTTDALAALARAQRIDDLAARELSRAYEYLRRLEHRLQMVEDQQTQSLPKDQAGMARLARFMGCADLESFEAELLATMQRVEAHYAELFEEAPSLSGPGNLVFTGGEPDPDTLATLAKLGYRDGTAVFHMVRSWHHGRFRATRSTRSRQLLTELMPALLTALGRTPNPDAALAKFHDFLSGLPAGVQLFSLLSANPTLLELLAEIMGSAPILADRLSRTPGLLDAVLTPGFFGPLPDQSEMAESCRRLLAEARDFQDVLDLSRRWANDQKFQVGVNVMRHTVSVDQAGLALSDTADVVIDALYGPVVEELARQHGRVPDARFAVVALGKYGGQEMTPSSDLDLIFMYDLPEAPKASDGPKPLEPGIYFARLAQRFISAITALTGEGRLYEIDMRLRPSGKAGPIATNLAAFRRYHEQDAWTWEAMALTRARVVGGEANFAGHIDALIRELLTVPRDPDKLLADVAAMRARIAREFPAKNLWDMKYLRGGLVDLDFMAQYQQLRNAAKHPEVLDRSTEGCFAKLAQAGLLGTSLAQRLIETTRVMRHVQVLLRLTASEANEEAAFPAGLKTALARAGGAETFDALKDALAAMALTSHEAFVEMIEEPAGQIAADPT